MDHLYHCVYILSFPSPNCVHVYMHVSDFCVQCFKAFCMGKLPVLNPALYVIFTQK